MITQNLNESQGLITLTLEEDLLSSNAERAHAEFEKILSRPVKVRDLCIDVTRCKMIDSVGLNLLFGVLQRAKEQGADPWLVINQGPMELVMHVARIDKIFKVQVKEKTPAKTETPGKNPQVHP